MALFTDGRDYETEDPEQAIRNLRRKAKSGGSEQTLWVQTEQGTQIAARITASCVYMTWEGSKYISVFEVHK